MLPTIPAMSRNRQASSPPARRAFTLVELLVVIGIIVVLMSILIPALAAARRQGLLVRCQSNLRQIATGFFEYAAENRQRFPPNTSPVYWPDDRYIGDILAKGGILKGNGLFTCPQDDEASRRSYSMNIWMSSAIDPLPVGVTPVGTLWGPTPRKSAQVILLIEAWSYKDNVNAGFSAPYTVGSRGDTPGKRFGAGGGVPPLNTFNPRYGIVNCEIDYARHRPRTYWAQRTEPGGLVNIAYADGHVAAKYESDLATRDTGLSTLDSLWSPLDETQNTAAAGARP
jgi:prepilin-type N-terminal cleavage/methylation domain-containing protein/prepilin-type processing-associated H-X9-DG protein